MTAVLAHESVTIPVAPHVDEDRVADVIELRPRPTVPVVPAGVYRRRRIVVAVALVVAAVGLAAGLRSLVPAGPVPSIEQTQAVLLEPGDTLWDLAVAATPAGGDPRVTLDLIRDLNGFGAPEVPAWTTVVVPAS